MSDKELLDLLRVKMVNIDYIVDLYHLYKFDCDVLSDYNECRPYPLTLDELIYIKRWLNL